MFDQLRLIEDPQLGKSFFVGLALEVDYYALGDMAKIKPGAVFG
jgi:hypothetical protein